MPARLPATSSRPRNTRPPLPCTILPAPSPVPPFCRADKAAVSLMSPASSTKAGKPALSQLRPRGPWRPLTGRRRAWSLHFGNISFCHDLGPLCNLGLYEVHEFLRRGSSGLDASGAQPLFDVG